MPAGELAFRLARSGDIAALTAIDTVVPIDSDRADHIRQWVEAGTCHIAARADMAIGYAVLHYHFFHSGMLELVMVGAEHRRQGVGEALARHVISICKTDKVWASTNQSNLPMQALLARLGFARSGIIENLDDGDPEFIYVIAARPKRPFHTNPPLV